jgi:hypothetical protein
LKQDWLVEQEFPDDPAEPVGPVDDPEKPDEEVKVLEQRQKFYQTQVSMLLTFFRGIEVPGK